MVLSSQLRFLSFVSLELVFALGLYAQTPVITGILNSATVTGGKIAPGELASITGSNLSSSVLQFCVVNDTAPLSCNGVSVSINGKAAPLFQTVPNLIEIEVPIDVTGTTATVQVTELIKAQTYQSAPFTIPLAPVFPGLYTNVQNGVELGSFINSAGTFVQVAVPANPGDVLTVVGTGFGTTSPMLPSGVLTPDSPAYQTTAQVSMTVGGKPATVSFAGLGAEYIGVDQVVFTVPQGVPAGLVPVVVTVGGVSSPPVMLPVGGAANVTISGVSNAASGTPGIESGSWIAIYGSNLSASTRPWQSSDINGNKLPLSLDGVSVTVNGKSAAVYYISPSQLDVLAPSDTATGSVQVQVTNGYGSGTGTATLQPYAPGLFILSGSNYAAAVHADGVYVAPAGSLGSVAVSRPAQPGETILLFGTGFGPTTPAVPDDQVVSGAAPLTDPALFHISIGGVPCTVQFAGITAAGEYQFNVVVPAVVDGDQPIAASIAGVSAQSGLSIPIKN